MRRNQRQCWLSLNFALAALATFGCDGPWGQVSEPSGPPKLTRALVQPMSRSCTRCAITDLLDTAAPAACAVDKPCPVAFVVNNTPVQTCLLPAGVCRNLLAAGPVGIGSPMEGNAVRLVFSKPLDPALDDLEMDSMGNSFPTLKPGIAEVDDSTGAEVPARKAYDPTGAAVTFDPIKAPFGPAIELDLMRPLAPSSQYTIKLNATRVVDRDGRTLTDSSGRPLPASYTLTFMTEAPMAPLSATPK